MKFPKTQRIVDKKYRQFVAGLPCAHCGLEGSSQCAHMDEGKGIGVKQCDSKTYPACCNSPDRVGCHDLIGTKRIYDQEERRKLEAFYVSRTQELARKSGLTFKAI